MKKILKYIVPVLFVVMILTVLAFYFVVPDRDVSTEENRALAQFPEVSLKSLASSEFTNGMINYMNDQFPFRDAFVKIGDGINDFLHLETKTSEGAQLVMNAGNAGGGAGERLGGDDLEIESKEVIEENPGGTTLVIDKGRAMEFYSFNDSHLEEYAAMLNKFADELCDVNVYSAIVPTSSEFYLPDNLRTDASSQKKAIEKVYANTNSNVKRVDVYSHIEGAAKIPGNYVYFNTDHHWTAKGAYEGYAAFCKVAGFDKVKLSDMKTAHVKGDFYGSFTRLTQNKDITENPDSIEYYLQPETKDVTAFTNADMKTPYDTDLFVNPGDAQNKYMVFLGGDHPLTRIITKADSDRSLLIIKDSFGNALTPFFVNHYKNIYVLDPRTATTDIREFCSQHGIDDLLIETYAFSLSSNGICKLFETLF